MTVNRATIIVIAVLFVVLAIVLLNWNKLFPAIIGDAASASGADGQASGSGKVKVTKADGSLGITGSNLNTKAILRQGYRGAEVTELQRILNIVEPANGLVEDGQFGPATATKLKGLYGQSAVSLEMLYNKYGEGYSETKNFILNWLKF